MMENKILHIVSKYYEVSTEEMQKSKTAGHAREMLCYLLRTHTDMKCADVAKMIARDHATVVTLANRVENNLKVSEALGKEVEELEHLLCEEEKISGLDKFFDFFRLEPVTNFKPGCAKKVSGKMEILIRVLFWILTGIFVTLWGSLESNAPIIIVLCGGIIFVEFLWSGARQFGYLVDIITHSLAVLVFVVATFCFNNYLIGLSIMGFCKCITDFEYRNLDYLNKPDEGFFVYWEGYMARHFKIYFLAGCFACFITFKSVGLI